MNNDNLQTQCNSCGRPMAYCSCGGCNKCSGINFCEYGDKKCGCIRNQKPECPYTAVIPSVTVEDVSNIKDLADCFVHVSKINTTFYIDDKHRITSVWQGPVEVSNYDIEENPLNLRSQFLLDYETGYVVYFNAQGEPMNLNDIDAIVERLEPELQEKINNKLDEMAEDGTLQEIIAPLITGEVEYIFPKMWVDGHSGDITIVKTPRKNILFDTHSSTKWTNVHEMLNENNVEHIDTVIISHYDLDHCGNINNLITYGYIDSSTTAYLSAIPQDFPQDYITTANNVKLALEGVNATVVYPNEGQEVTLDSEVMLKVQFANCDADAISAMTPRYNNNASMCCFITQKNTHSFIGGDSVFTVQDRLYKLGYPKTTVDLYKIAHHGYEYECNVNFIEELRPKYAVITAQGIESFADGLHSYTKEFSILSNAGCNIYACYDQKDYIKFASNGNGMECNSGKCRVFDNASVDRDIYVNKNADITKIQDGTVEHPYSEISQALASIPNSKCQEVTIHLADGAYHTATSGNHYLERLRVNGNKNTLIRIVGNTSDNTAVILDNIQVSNCNVVLNSVTLHTDRFDAIRCIRGNIIVQNSIIEASDNLAHDTDGIYLTHNSIAQLNNVSIKNVRHAFNISNGSKCYLTGSTTVYDHSGSVTLISGASELITNTNLHFDTPSDNYNFAGYNIQNTSPVQIAKSHDAFAATVDLAKNITSFKMVEVVLKTNDNYIFSTGRIFNNGGGCNIPVTAHVKSGANKIVLKTGRLQLSGTTASILGGVATTINGSTVNAVDTSGLFDIVAIYGWYSEDFIDVA